MKTGATLINVGRGNAVDTEALCDALEDGKLYAASLDVTDPEPLPCDHRLWKIENALITPHISGFFHLRKTYENIGFYKYNKNIFTGEKYIIIFENGSRYDAVIFEPGNELAAAIRNEMSKVKENTEE